MKYALVTGGSRGIGRAVCVKLAQMGYHIIINYVSNATEAQKTLELVRQAGQDGEILMFDVSNRQQTSKAIESWENAHPEEYIEVLPRKWPNWLAFWFRQTPVTLPVM